LQSPGLPDTRFAIISGTFRIKITTYLLWNYGDEKLYAFLWLGMVAIAAALALPARANTWPFRRRAAVWSGKISFMWSRITAVRWKRSPKSTTSVSGPAAG
jgi:hypothetical protein